jgi:hypothetical protein
VAVLACPILPLAWHGLQAADALPIAWAAGVIGALALLAATARGQYTWPHALGTQPTSSTR